MVSHRLPRTSVLVVKFHRRNHLRHGKTSYSCRNPGIHSRLSGPVTPCDPSVRGNLGFGGPLRPSASSTTTTAVSADRGGGERGPSWPVSLLDLSTSTSTPSLETDLGPTRPSPLSLSDFNSRRNQNLYWNPYWLLRFELTVEPHTLSSVSGKNWDEYLYKLILPKLMSLRVSASVQYRPFWSSL